MFKNKYKVKLKSGITVKTNKPPFEIKKKYNVEWIKERKFLLFWVEVDE